MTSHPNGQLISRETVLLPPHLQSVVARMYDRSVLSDTTAERIMYWSDDLRVAGYLAYPKAEGRYPLLLWNRGGFGDRGAITDLTAHLILASTAIWGYAVLATQYRGNAGGEGHEDWGNRDVYDALHLLETARTLPFADTTRVGIEGASRGGMTSYRILQMYPHVRCVIVHAGVSNVFKLAETMPDFAKFVRKQFGHLSAEERDREISLRSAVLHVDRFPKHVPVMLLHGAEDRTIPPAQSEELAGLLAEHGIPHEHVVLPEAGHVALKDGSYREIDRLRRAWLGKYLL